MFISSLRFWTAFQNVDYKFLLIPVAFILLRVWSCLMTIIVIYCDCKESVNYHVLISLNYLEVCILLVAIATIATAAGHR